MTVFRSAEAFERNFGLISRDEQKRLGGALVSIAGCGGVGGLHAHALARVGIGRFRVTDPDTFSLPNINRQIGATVHTLGENKAVVTAQMIRSINPEASVEITEPEIGRESADAFVKGADLVVDGIDFFAVAARRALFAAAWRAGIPAVTAAPLGFSSTLHVFAPGGMSFDEYFDLREDQKPLDQLVNFLAGLAPKALHVPYMDLGSVDTSSGRGPSSIIGTQLAASLVAAEAVRIILARGPSRLAPNYLQIDAYRQCARKGFLRQGNRSWSQQVNRRLLKERLCRLGWDRAFTDADENAIVQKEGPNPA
ncbi:MAG TPA: ThiF family adenylyltransferase [Candidatus Binatia bacterium]|jgi:molybdopterin/thiamine biosynthesis adenylyltransferase